MRDTMAPSGTSRAPLYSVIADHAETLIRSGDWPVGHRLPPERQLCRELDVSRSTLRQALGELEDRGLVLRRQGRGTFVARPRVQADLTGFFSISEALRARGVSVTTRVITVEVVEASRQLAAELGRLPGDPLVHIERLRHAEGEPLVLESAHLPLELFPGLPEADLAARSLYDVLREDHGRAVAEATETIEPVILTPRECAILGVPRHTPAILTRRITRDRDGVVVEHGQALLRGDRSRFLLVRQVDEGSSPASPDLDFALMRGTSARPSSSHRVVGSIGPLRRPDRPIPPLPQEARSR
jgi:GntR family transcriptional regulator